MTRATSTNKRVTKAEMQLEAMRAYSEWLFMKLRLLGIEMEPGYEPAAAGKFLYCGTAARRFHIHKDNGFNGWQRNPPSSRALPMMRALGIDVAKHIRRDKRAVAAALAGSVGRKRRA